MPIKKTTKNTLASEAPALDPNEQINIPSTNYNINTNSLSAFLAKFKVNKGQEFTHTSLGPPYGSYYISDIYIEQFFDLYTKSFKNLSQLHITERHKAFSPILIDLDFKQDTSNRIYNINYIQKFINTFLKILKDFIIYDNLHIYVLEKGKPRKCSSGYKDGIHIVIPDVITCPAIQYEIRNIMISEYSDSITLNDVTNNVEDIYDKSVIKNNNWFLYGSRKPDEEFSWKVTHIYEFDSKFMNEIDIVDAEEEYIKLLSIRYNVHEENRYSELGEKIIKDNNIPKSITRNVTTKNDLDIINELINILDKSRADSYDTWIKVGWCLHNIDEYLLPKWIEFSKQSTSYNPGECEKLWDRMKDSGLGIGTLHMWAKEDDQQEYYHIIHKQIYDDIKYCNGTHNSIAAITYKILKNNFVCATANGKLWYEFNGSLWKEDKEAVHLRHELSTTIRQQYIYAYHTSQKKLSIDDMQSNGSNNKKTHSEMLSIAMKLQDANFKDNIIKEMREYFYDGNFLKKLDSYTHLIGFTNGVWDFTIHNFRQANPEDCISLHVGYDYIPEKNLDYTKMVEDYLKKLHPVEEQRSYLIQTIARQLYGDNGNELFHIHAGYLKSAGNGKTKFWESIECCTGDYTRKFPVQVLTTKMREEAGKPAPEYQYWKGRRILYCTEPNEDEILHSGIMKDLTGGEKILYRLLYSNDILDFRPQFKMHIMCNGPPKVDGSDEGVRRRIRKIDYISKFVDSEFVNESNYCFKKDSSFIDEIKKNNALKMEFLRYLLDHFDIKYEFKMPKVIEDNSKIYLDENDSINKFIKEHIIADKDGHFLLSEAKSLFKSKEYYNNKLNQLKNDLVKALGCICNDIKTIKGKTHRSVFMGYNILTKSLKDTSSISELRFKSEIEKYTGLVFEKSYPKWLINTITGAQMEIDLYNESQNIAIEYNGYQHYEFPNKFHKTIKEFNDQISRDILKEKLCIEHGIKFIKIKSNDSICEEIEQYKRQINYY
jgi:phage/plasmid-associated DNA primase